MGIPESRWATVIDPCTIVSASAPIGHCTYIGPGTVFEPTVHLGSHCAILGNVYIAHESHLADYVVCTNSVSIAGWVSVGKASFIGSNAMVREYTHIWSRAVVGMGRVVIRDVADGQIVVGNPDRVAKKHSD